MKRWILGLCAIAWVACGGGNKPGGGHGPTVAIGGYRALRWVPPQATYAVTSHTVREAQQGMRDLIETFGIAADVTVADVSRALAGVLLVDPLSTDGLAQLGVDLDGGFALYSDAFDPTVVVHLAAPSAFHDFIARQTKLRTQNVVVDGVEVFTAKVDDDLRISWAVADDWLWVHFAMVADDDRTTWFSASRHPSGSAAWDATLAWAKGGGEPPVVGFADVAHFALLAAAKEPAFDQCLRSLELGSRGLGQLAVSIAGDPKQASVKIALDIGPVASAGIARALMQPPEGWYTATAQVPIAAQWNLDLAAIKARVEPCARTIGFDLHELDELGMRTARAFVRSFDPDNREGTGAIALDLAHKDFFAAKLDDIPLRGTLERKRTFGPYAGKSLAIPMFVTVDYVLTDQLALAGVGDGLLAVLVGKGGTIKAPIAEVAVQPLGLSRESWIELLRLADLSNPKRITEGLLRWRQARVNLTMDGTRLVLAASGTRR